MQAGLRRAAPGILPSRRIQDFLSINDDEGIDVSRQPLCALSFLQCLHSGLLHRQARAESTSGVIPACLQQAGESWNPVIYAIHSRCAGMTTGQGTQFGVCKIGLSLTSRLRFLDSSAACSQPACRRQAGMTTLDGFMQSLHNMENPEILQFKET